MQVAVSNKKNMKNVQLAMTIILLVANLFALVMVFDLYTITGISKSGYIGEEGVVLLFFPVLYLPVALVIGLVKRILLGKRIKKDEKSIINFAYFILPVLECIPLLFNPLVTWVLYLYFLFVISSVIILCVELKFLH